MTMSREMRWFTETLRFRFDVKVAAEEVAIEAVELGMDEVEDFFVPVELFEEAPTSLLYEMMVHDDEQENLWVAAIAFYPNTPNWCIQVITKNGEAVLRQLLPFV